VVQQRSRQKFHCTPKFSIRFVRRCRWKIHIRTVQYTNVNLLAFYPEFAWFEISRFLVRKNAFCLYWLVNYFMKMPSTVIQNAVFMNKICRCRTLLYQSSKNSLNSRSRHLRLHLQFLALTVAFVFLHLWYLVPILCLWVWTVSLGFGRSFPIGSVYSPWYLLAGWKIPTLNARVFPLDFSCGDTTKFWQNGKT
jgi:hypothetical protein